MGRECRRPRREAKGQQLLLGSDGGGRQAYEPRTNALPLPGAQAMAEGSFADTNGVQLIPTRHAVLVAEPAGYLSDDNWPHDCEYISCISI